MFKDLLNGFKKKKQSSSNIEPQEKREFEINVSKYNNINKIEISDYITTTEYTNKRDSGEEYQILDMIRASVLWNSRKQMINKGTYYVTSINNHLFNILFTENKIIINERITELVDEDEKQTIANNLHKEASDIGEYITCDKTITFYPNQNNYTLSILKHADDDTYYTKYYSRFKTVDMGDLMLTDEESYNEIHMVLSNLHDIDNIEEILDFNSLYDILNDTKKEL